jgi:hypothetical protein
MIACFCSMKSLGLRGVAVSCSSLRTTVAKSAAGSIGLGCGVGTKWLRLRSIQGGMLQQPIR